MYITRPGKWFFGADCGMVESGRARTEQNQRKMSISLRTEQKVGRQKVGW